MAATLETPAAGAPAPGSGVPGATDRRSVSIPLIVAGIAVLFFALRLALIWRFPPFWDEAGYGEWAKAAVESPGTRFEALREAKEPLTSWLGAVFIHGGADYLQGVRLVSLTAGAVTLTMLGLVGRRISTPVALVAMALYAGLPLFAVHESLGLMEPTVAAASMCALYCAIRMAERPSLDMALLLGVAMAAGIMTKESGRFAIAMIPLALLLFDWHSPGLARRAVQWAGGVALAAVVCIGLYSTLSLSPLWDTYVAGGDPDLRHSLTDGFTDPWKWISHSFPQLAPGLLGYAGPVLLGLALAGIALVPRERWRLMAVVAAWGLLPFVGALVFANNGYVRYWLPALAPLVIPMAVGLLWLVAQARERTRGAQRTVAIAGTLAIALALPAVLMVRVLADPDTARYPGKDDEQYVTSWAAGTAWKDVARDFEQRTGGAQVIVGLDRPRPFFIFLEHPERVLRAPLGTPETGQAQYLIRNYDTALTAAERRDFRLEKRFPRPRGGQAIELYVRR